MKSTAVLIALLLIGALLVVGCGSKSLPPKVVGETAPITEDQEVAKSIQDLDSVDTLSQDLPDSELEELDNLTLE